MLTQQAGNAYFVVVGGAVRLFHVTAVEQDSISAGRDDSGLGSMMLNGELGKATGSDVLPGAGFGEIALFHAAAKRTCAAVAVGEGEGEEGAVVLQVPRSLYNAHVREAHARRVEVLGVMETLRGMGVFAGWREPQLSRLAFHATPAKFPRGATLLEQGAAPAAVLCVVAGSVRLVAGAATPTGTGGSPRELRRCLGTAAYAEGCQLAQVGPGDVLGVDAVLRHGEPHAYSAVAETAVEALEVPADAFARALRSDRNAQRAMTALQRTRGRQRARLQSAAADAVSSAAPPAPPSLSLPLPRLAAAAAAPPKPAVSPIVAPAPRGGAPLPERSPTLVPRRTKRGLLPAAPVPAAAAVPGPQAPKPRARRLSFEKRPGRSVVAWSDDERVRWHLQQRVGGPSLRPGRPSSPSSAPARPRSSGDSEALMQRTREAVSQLGELGGYDVEEGYW